MGPPFKVFPLVPGKKTPLIDAWQKLATDDIETICDWSHRWPNANVGIATGAASGVLVIDLDVKDGRDGMRDLATLAKAGKRLPPSPIALTPSGGRHLFFRHTRGIRNVVGVTKAGRGLGPGVDVRSDGGFVVGASSVLPNGTYRWLVPPSSAGFSALPEWATKMLMPPAPQPPSIHASATGEGRLDGAVNFVARSPQGTRNPRLFWAACRAGELVARRLLTEAAAINQLVHAARAAGLPFPEAINTIRSGLNTGRANPFVQR
jgi:hypothetical protein